MPKQTFHKLNPDKKKALMSACFSEFANYSFAEASISRIVKSLGIAKGSIYQYFEDKQELYEFLIDESIQRKYAILNFVLNRNLGDLEQWYFDACLAQIKFAQEFPQMYKLMQRATFESDHSSSDQDYEYVERAINKLQSLKTVDINSEEVFLLSAMKETITERHRAALSDEVMSEIEDICQRVVQIVTK